MERPQSIIWFERLFLGSIALGLVSTIINWSAIQALTAATPNSELLPSWFMPATLLAGLAINLLLWFFIARTGSVVAKWIFVVIIGLGLLGLPSVFLTPYPYLIKLFSLLNYGMQIAAAWMLFRPDAVAWFKGERGKVTDVFD